MKQAAGTVVDSSVLLDLFTEDSNPVGRQTAARAAGGHGIPGMCERAALLDGTFEAGREGDSFVVRAALPFAGRDP